MSTRSYPVDVVAQVADILAACKQIDPNLQAGPLTQKSLADDLAKAQEAQAQIAVLELQLTDLRNRRDERLNRMWEATKRLRATVKGVYGDDSSEYELVGGTRRGDRKRAARRPTA